MRIFITGASGFIGQHIVKLLSEEPLQLLLLVKDKKSCKQLEKYNTRIIVCDLKNIHKIKDKIADFDPQICVHLAWEGIPDYSYEVSKKNLDHSIALINLIVNNTNCRKFVMSGSCYEYGKAIGVCKESNKVKINSYFSWAKYALYRYCKYICNESDIDLIWYRIFYVYGPGQRKESLIPTLIHAFRNKKTPKILLPFNANDFIYVGDVAKAFKMAITNKMISGIYNLGTGKSTRVIDICKIIENMIYGSTCITNRINIKQVSSVKVNFLADTNKTQKTLSWRPIASINEGIKDYLMEMDLK